LARWRRDGTLAFLGRADRQVKIRGFRIEPAEVESCLLAQPGVAQAAVTVHEAAGSKQLAAYVVASSGAAIEVGALRRWLERQLPDYMVPSLYTVLDALPLTGSGKVDRRALPAPQRQEAAYRAPATPSEQVLCGLFAELLGLERVGIGDNFFAIGGDSIVSIQLVSRARQAGLELTPRDVFQHQTVEALAAASQAASPAAAWDAAAGLGTVTPTPILAWFLDRGGPLERFSQSVLLEVPAAVTEATLAAALQAMLDTHDALRLRVWRAGRVWRLEVPARGTVAAADLLQRVDLVGLDAATRRQRMAAVAQAAQDRLDPAAGRLVSAVWYPPAAGSAGRLLLVVHHLAVDGVSWRVLVPELAAAWARLSQGEELPAGSRAMPFRVWAAHLAERAGGAEVATELPYWQAQAAEGGALLPGARLDAARDTFAQAGHLRLELPVALTRALLGEVAGAFHGGINEVLLSAVAVAVAGWRQARGEAAGPLLVELEGHGREPLDSDLDPSRTVGWFTSLYPARLELGGLDVAEARAGGPAAGQALKLIKEQLRAVPGRGLGYGLLRYLHTQAGPELARLAAAQVGFNYFGRIAEDRGAWSAVAGDDADLLPPIDPATPLFHLLDINAQTTDGAAGPQLSAVWSWSRAHLPEAEVRALATGWRDALQGLAAHVSQGGGGHTPSDFPLLRLTQEQVEQLEAAYPGLRDVLPLSPLQEGLAFHALYDTAAADVYAVQFEAVLEGALAAARLRAAAEALLARHANLRAAMVHEGLRRPVQVIADGVALPWRELDLSGLEAATQEQRRTAALATELAERLVLSRAPLLRLLLLRLAPERHQLVLTCHHILMDGWSMPVL
ncbi:MAG TPA: condensation domain-containing protein, partial [Nevskia sp.]|nr:condensation domain-containing protein [Nevskia sp.]